jgi:hypothetical protein
LSEIARYDRIGTGYSLTRREDPSIARILRDALGDVDWASSSMQY